MEAETKYLLAVLKALLQGQSLELPKEDINYSRLFSIATRNSVANMAAYYFEKGYLNSLKY